MVWSIDRMGRSTATVAAALAELEAAGVAIYADKSWRSWSGLGPQGIVLGRPHPSALARAGGRYPAHGCGQPVPGAEAKRKRGIEQEGLDRPSPGARTGCKTFYTP
jgi:hypothetical protein